MGLKVRDNYGVYTYCLPIWVSVVCLPGDGSDDALSRFSLLIVGPSMLGMATMYCEIILKDTIMIGNVVFTMIKGMYSNTFRQEIMITSSRSS